MLHSSSCWCWTSTFTGFSGRRFANVVLETSSFLLMFLNIKIRLISAYSWLFCTEPGRISYQWWLLLMNGLYGSNDDITVSTSWQTDCWKWLPILVQLRCVFLHVLTVSYPYSLSTSKYYSFPPLLSIFLPPSSTFFSCSSSMRSTIFSWIYFPFQDRMLQTFYLH